MLRLCCCLPSLSTFLTTCLFPGQMIAAISKMLRISQLLSIVSCLEACHWRWHANFIATEQGSYMQEIKLGVLDMYASSEKTSKGIQIHRFTLVEPTNYGDESKRLQFTTRFHSCAETNMFGTSLTFQTFLSMTGIIFLFSQLLGKLQVCFAHTG